jgi:phosphate ABC transporter phosphate-binding protein
MALAFTIPKCLTGYPVCANHPGVKRLAYSTRTSADSRNSSLHTSILRSFLLLAFLSLPQLASLATAQQPAPIKSIRTVYIAPMTGSEAANAVRARLIARLKKNSSIRLVDDASSADAVLHGSAVIWPTGTVSIDPRSNTISLRNYQGYLSAELSDASNQPLWSYLVTPSRFRTAGIVDDLADQLGSRLEAAIATGLSGTTALPSAAHTASTTLRAAGATFPAPLYQLWFRSFAREPDGLSITYDPIGSAAGLTQLADGKIDMAASDIPAIPAQSGAAPTPSDVLHIPTVIGGVVPVYNLPGDSHGLDLTPQLLADIFSGKIRKWNDPRIRQWNKDTHLPDAEITVVHRSDGSGTTYVFTSYLAQASPDWKSRVGATVDWPTGVSAAGNEGIAEQVSKTPNSISYIELTYAIQHQMTYAAVRNPAGRFIRADIASIAAAVAAHVHTGEDDLRFSTLNSPARDAYPIASFTWLLVPRTNPDPRKRAAEARFLHWMLTTGQKQCSSLGYAPLPADIAREALLTVDSLR